MSQTSEPSVIFRRNIPITIDGFLSVGRLIDDIVSCLWFFFFLLFYQLKKKCSFVFLKKSAFSPSPLTWIEMHVLYDTRRAAVAGRNKESSSCQTIKTILSVLLSFLVSPSLFFLPPRLFCFLTPYGSR